MASVRHRSSIATLSWFPSGAVEGSTRLAFEVGVANCDQAMQCQAPPVWTTLSLTIDGDGPVKGAFTPSPGASARAHPG